MADAFETEIEIEAPVEEVFRHLVEPDAMVRWMGQHADLEPHPGGRFELDINGVPVRGRYVEVEAPTRVVVTWGMAGNDEVPPGATRVEFVLTPTERGTRLRLLHRGLPEAQVEQHETGWGHFLARLTEASSGRDPGPDPWAARQ